MTTARIPVTSNIFALNRVSFTTLDCAKCGVLFAFTDEFYDQRQYDGATFYCPNGHPNCFGAERRTLQERIEQLEGRAARLNAEVDYERAARAAADRSRAAFKGQLTRARTRARAGVCQWCNRSFANVKRHMDSRHPGVNPAQHEDQQP